MKTNVRRIFACYSCNFVLKFFSKSINIYQIKPKQSNAATSPKNMKFSVINEEVDSMRAGIHVANLFVDCPKTGTSYFCLYHQEIPTCIPFCRKFFYEYFSRTRHISACIRLPSYSMGRMCNLQKTQSLQCISANDRQKFFDCFVIVVTKFEFLPPSTLMIS